MNYFKATDDQRAQIEHYWAEYGQHLPPDADKTSAITFHRLMTVRNRLAKGLSPVKPPPCIEPATREMINISFGLKTLDNLDKSGMTPKQACEFDAVLDHVRKWLKTDKSLVLSSPQFGIGKTAIAQIIADAFKLPVSGGGEPQFVDGEPDFELWDHATMIKSRDLMALFQDANKDPFKLLRRMRLIVIDEVGDEGNLVYVAKDNQTKEMQSRYYALIDWAASEGKRIVITTNLTKRQLFEQHFSGKTVSRLIALVGVGNFINMPDLPDYRIKQAGL